MRTVAIVCNVALLAIAAVIVLTEGLPGEGRFLALTLLVLLVPLFSAVVLIRERMAARPTGAAGGGSSAASLANLAAVLANIVLLIAVCWAVVVQYPFPEGNSMIPLAVLAVCTPILSLITLLGGTRKTLREKGLTAAGGSVSA